MEMMIVEFFILNSPLMDKNKKVSLSVDSPSIPLFSSHRFKTMVDQSPAATSIYNSKGEILFYNPAYKQLWKYEEDHFLSYNLFNDSELQEDVSDIKAVFENGITLKIAPKRIKQKGNGQDEIYIGSTFFALKNKNEIIEEVVLIQENITPLLQTNTELRRNIKEISNLKDALDISSIITEVDAEGKLIRGNSQFFEISGYLENEVSSLSIDQLRSGNMSLSFYNELWNTIRKGKIWKGEMENRSKMGEIYWTETTIVPMNSASGEPQSYMGISSNITERKIAEQEIIKLNSRLEKEVKKRTEDIDTAVAELEAFSYSVSHDLRAPLRAITGFSGLLNEEFGDDLNEEAKRYLGIIQSGTKQMAQLIDDLLQFSRVGRIELQKKVFDPLPIIHEIIKKEKVNNNKVEFVFNPMVKIYGDANTITLVFTNLILNAIKFSRQVKSPVITIGSKAGKEEEIYYVKDNGVGFDMRYSDKLFKVFQRLHSVQQFEGTGVGLAIVSRIIYKHGGRVWGESHPGSDTSFYFSLPNEHYDE